MPPNKEVISKGTANGKNTQPPATVKKKGQDTESLKKESDVTEHKLPVDQLCAELGTDPKKGLTSDKAKEILQRDGPNALTPPKKTSEWVKFAKNLFGGFALLLWIGAGLCFVAWGIEYASNPEAPWDNVRRVHMFH